MREGGEREERGRREGGEREKRDKREGRCFHVSYNPDRALSALCSDRHKH